jgi:hypothetical protein
MKSDLYRLYDVQSFNGKKIAIYINHGEFPEAEFLSDVQEIVDKNKGFSEVVNSKPDYYKASTNSINNRDRLIFYTRILRRSQEILAENDNVDKAIFLETTVKTKWRGEQTLYYNRLFDAVKCNSPNFPGCTKMGTIII